MSEIGRTLGLGLRPIHHLRNWLVATGTASGSGFSRTKRFARFGAQIQLQLAVNPIHPLVIPAIALHVEQV